MLVLKVFQAQMEQLAQKENKDQMDQMVHRVKRERLELVNQVRMDPPVVMEVSVMLVNKDL